MLSRSKKWSTTVASHLSRLMAYKLDFVMLVLAPPLIFFLIKFNLWVSLYRLTGSASFGGYGVAEMIEYQAYALIVALLAQSYSGSRLSEDIRFGRISAFLLYPFEFWEYHGALFLAGWIVELAISVVLLALMWHVSWLHNVSVAALAAGFFLTALAGAFWFAVIFTLGLLSFWMEDTWILRMIFGIITTFLSGGMIPLELFPPGAVVLLNYLPFPYLTFVPVKIFAGTYDGSLLQAFLTMTAWLVAAAMLCRLTWRRGIRLYSAAGM